MSALALPTRCECGASVTAADVLDPAYECSNGHYFTRPEAGDSNICPECSRPGRRIGTACPECREPLSEQQERHSACGTAIVVRGGVPVCPRCMVENPR